MFEESFKQDSVVMNACTLRFKKKKNCLVKGLKVHVLYITKLGDVELGFFFF